MIPEQFTKNGFHYTLVSTHEITVNNEPQLWAIYEQEIPPKNYFELVRVRTHKKEYFNKKAGDQYLPGTEKWGKEGFTLRTREEAIQKLNKVAEGF